jgi:hypothetical protein
MAPVIGDERVDALGAERPARALHAELTTVPPAGWI